jgi:UDP-N-acetylglucosamine--N-acetylmuramyl-(pentapeptide) pyrophosphoryl-undecaprenol N-acetylglucosamine transferase
MLPMSAIDAWRVLSRRRPSIVIGVGGYSSGPVVLLAALRGIPTLLMEQNAMPGVTNRLLARFVKAAAVTYDESARFFAGRAFLAGNPVRPEFLGGGHDEQVLPHEGQRAARVLVFGGSQGAHASTWPWWRQRRGWLPPHQVWRLRIKRGNAIWKWSGTATAAQDCRLGSNRFCTRWTAR